MSPLLPCIRICFECGGGNAGGGRFRQGILYCHWVEGEQLVVPKDLRDKMQELDHSHPWAGHLSNYCKSCPSVSTKGNRAPLGHLFAIV